MNRPLTPPARPKPLRRREGPSLPPTLESEAMTQVGGREKGRGGLVLSRYELRSNDSGAETGLAGWPYWIKNCR